MANSTTPSVSLPPGYSPPLYTITEIDKAGIVVIVTAVCLITAFVSILVRAYVMIQTGTLRLRWDDWAVVVALLLAIIQTSIVQGEAAAGLGRTVRELTDRQSHQIQRLQYADQIFYILSVWVSKLSATLFFYRLSPRMNDRKMSKAVMALVGFTGVAAILSLCFVCAITQPWQYFTSEGVTCTSPYSRWVSVSVLDIVSEVALACTATKILWPLQMPLSRKLTAGFVFFQRLIVIAPILAQLYFLSLVYHSDDPTLQAAYSTLCKEIQITFAIVATNIPSFRTFLIATATHYGAAAEGVNSSYGYSAGAGESVKLASLTPDGKMNSITQQQSSQGSRSSRRLDFSPRDRNQSVAAVVGGGIERCDAVSDRSDGSREMIIRKDVNYDVQYYDGAVGLNTRSENEQNT